MWVDKRPRPVRQQKLAEQLGPWIKHCDLVVGQAGKCEPDEPVTIDLKALWLAVAGRNRPTPEALTARIKHHNGVALDAGVPDPSVRGDREVMARPAAARVILLDLIGARIGRSHQRRRRQRRFRARY